MIGEYILFEQGTDGQLVALQAEAANHAAAGAGDERVVTVILAGEDVAQVHLNLLCWYCQQGVAQGHASVAVAAQVDYQSVAGETGLLYAVDKFALDIALEMADFHLGEHCTKAFDTFIHCGGAVHFRLAATRKVQVGSVDNLDMFHAINNGANHILLYKRRKPLFGSGFRI